MKRRRISIIAAGGACALAVAASALAAGGSETSTVGASRLDDGKGLLAQAHITEQQAIAAALSATSGELNEVDLEQAGSSLVFNVDVGRSDVKVDASDGHVVRVDRDD